MQKQRLFYGLTLAFVLVLSFSVSASPGIPIDIPGTQVHFFTLRYEATAPPYDQVELIWQRLSSVFQQWVEDGQNPEALSPEMVIIENAPQGKQAIFLKGTLIVEVDSYHAQVNRASIEQVARVWADNLREGITIFVENNTPR